MTTALVKIGHITYEIDEYGNIPKIRGEGFRVLFPDKDGYLKVTVRDKRYPTHNEALHRVVFRAFHGEIPDGMTVDHIDDDKTNNHKDNLQLLTPEENAAKGNAQHWLVMSPEGEEYNVYNLEAFCREHNLHASHLANSGYKGWKCYDGN